MFSLINFHNKIHNENRKGSNQTSSKNLTYQWKICLKNKKDAFLKKKGGSTVLTLIHQCWMIPCSKKLPMELLQN